MSTVPDPQPIVRLADKVRDVRYDQPADTLRDMLNYLESGWYEREQDFVPTSCVVIMLDARNGAYRTKVRPSAMKTSETIALLQVSMATMLNDLLRSE